MKGKAILLATLMVVSMAVAGVGGAAAASTADSVQESTHQPVQTQENTTNATPQAAGSDGSGDAGPHPVDIPPNQLKDRSVDAVPASGDVDQGPYNTGASAARSGSKADAQLADAGGDPQYNPTGPVRKWPSSNYATDSPNLTDRYYLKNYTLRVVAPQLEIWVANNLSYPKGDTRPTPEITDNELLYLADEYTNNIYPKESDLWRKPVPQYGNDTLYPGLPSDYYQSSDNKSRTVLLVDNIKDESYYNSSYPTYVAGLFAPNIGTLTDRNVILADSNDWEDRLGSSDAPWKDGSEGEEEYGIDGTLAHEYQHLLHNYADSNEESWINEGLSDFTEEYVGYGVPGSHVETYEQYPSNSLVNWDDQIQTVGPITGLADYGAAALFQMYGYQQFGEEFNQKLFNDDANGMQSVRDALNETNADRDFYGLYQDFSTALVTDGLDAPDEYQIENVDIDMDTSKSVPYTKDNLTSAYGNAYNPLDPKSGSVDDLDASGIDFPGTSWRSVEDPTGDTDHEVLYSGSGNGLDRFAIFNADLSGTNSPTLKFDTNYAIEPGYDYAFVQVSTDGGDTWQSLSNENTTSYRHDFINPTAEANLPGFTNSTNGEWVNEQFDLSQYAGQDVKIAFRYVTDPATAYPGFYARDISVSGTDIDYDGSSTEPFESLREAQQNYLRYQFSLLGIGEDGSTEVQQYDPTEFPDNGSADLEPLLDGDYDRTLLTATWAPESEEGGTVPYGYDVNAGEDSGGENTLTIRGSGDRSFYALRASSDVAGSGLSSEDSVSGNTASGAVGGGADTYTFAGDLENLYVAKGATVYLNGERVDPDDYESTLSVVGSGEYSSYDFTVRNGKITDTDGLTSEDSVSGNSASGAIAGGSDEYTFTGTFKGLDVDGDASLVLNGQTVPASTFYNTISFEGTGSLTTYEFSVDGEIQHTAGITGEDSVAESHAMGAVRNGADTYVYSGIITDLSYSTDNGKTAVTRNGERITENDA